MLRLMDKASMLTETEKAQCISFIKKDHTDWSQFNATAMVAKLGEVFCNGDQKATNQSKSADFEGSNISCSNDWKKRMLEAGLTKYGLTMPENWNELSEEDKETRLNLVIESLKKNEDD